MTETFEVRIRGQVFKLKSQVSSEYVRELAQYVNDVMGQVAQESYIASSERTAIMAALKIADDFLQHQRLVSRQTEVAKEKISSLIAHSDQLLKG
ncbi:MAG: cell division protein ZapA [Magnetococcales bacterium]|nr:cell division protein ZapA [Magnetococcales bacterium]MBF0271083.1 cell division protein ZapA [Magnetococcales bacterium]